MDGVYKEDTFEGSRGGGHERLTIATTTLASFEKAVEIQLVATQSARFPPPLVSKSHKSAAGRGCLDVMRKATHQI